MAAPIATVSEIGLTKKDIHEARQIRDVESASPGITRRTLPELWQLSRLPPLGMSGFLSWAIVVFSMGAYMGTREFAREMKAAVEQLKSQGIAAIYIDNLINYLSSVEQSPDPNPSPTELERYRAELNQHIEAMKHANAARLELFRSVILAGQNAIRTMIAVNGAASVAMLAFIGHLARIGSSAIPTYAMCLGPFVIGTLLAALVSGSTYLSQWLYGGTSEAGREWGWWINLLAIALGLASFVAFGIGAYWTYDAFLTTPPLANPAFVTLSE